MELLSISLKIFLRANMLYYILFVHWISDFVFQSRWMAEGKSSKWIPLVFHIAVYGFFLTVLLLPFYQYSSVLTFGIINTLAHLLVDSITAPISAKFYKMGNIHAFFCTVGFDQFLHTCCLVFTMGLLK